MNNWKQIVGISGTTFCLVLIMVPFSFIIGWNLISILIFWFLIVPLVSITVPYIIRANERRQFQSIIGMILFYGIMIFMIYNQSATDYFKLMAVSGVVNLVLLIGIYNLATNILIRKNNNT